MELLIIYLLNTEKSYISLFFYHYADEMGSRTNTQEEGFKELRMHIVLT